MRPDPLRTVDPFNAEWVTIVLLLAVGLLALINLGAPRKWGVLAQALFRLRLGRQVLRDEVDLRDRALLGLLVLAVSVLALFGWQMDQMWRPDVHHSYGWWALVVGGVLAGQLVVNGSLARFIGDRSILMEHSYTGLLLHVLAGLLLLPVVAVLAYRSEWRHELLWTGMVILALLLLYRWFRGGWLGLSEGVPGRHILLYLCAAEVLPALLLVSLLHAV
ncbi:MAG: DUF4271 domain-containing protein [Flavobacteriales bacterium]|jgi:hypothetical protein|nr:DUF4271 domain-containing protein [Flavobacteriales bacterium]